MDKEEIRKAIAQNEERIARKEEQIKKLQAEAKQLKDKNEALKNELILTDVRKADVSADDIADLLVWGKLVKASGLSDAEIKEMFQIKEDATYEE